MVKNYRIVYTMIEDDDIDLVIRVGCDQSISDGTLTRLGNALLFTLVRKPAKWDVSEKGPVYEYDRQGQGT